MGRQALEPTSVFHLMSDRYIYLLRETGIRIKEWDLSYLLKETGIRVWDCPYPFDHRCLIPLTLEES